MNKKGFFTGLIIIVVLLVVGFFWFVGERNEEDLEDRCVSNEECVPELGCHPTKCILEEELIENPETMFCTAVCSGPLDCGAGSCGCVNNKCEIIPDDD